VRRRNFWGWGYEDGAPSEARVEHYRARLANAFGGPPPALRAPPALSAIDLPASRIAPPATLTALCRVDPRERAAHTYGKAFRDVVRGLDGDFRVAPDVVAYPGDESDLVRLLDWAHDARLAVIPYGAGSSVTGGVEARLDGDWSGALSVDLSRLDAVIEVDETSRAAHIQAGIYGPALEDALRPRGLTLRHYPQSFELSTLGGWLATRSGGHFATLHTHIDDFVEALRVLTPRGVVETRRLPGSGAGPQPERLFLGSEGILGIITSAWMRLQQRPSFRASATVRFDDFMQGAEAARELAQSGLHPSNCRLIHSMEALMNGAGDGSSHLLLVAFESADHPLEAWMDRALSIVRGAGGRVDEDDVHYRTDSDDGESSRANTGDAWRRSFVQAPYVRDLLVRLGVVTETFETAITWDRFAELHERILRSVEAEARRLAGSCILTTRITHVYPDGLAPYYTLIAPGRPGALLETWDSIKAVASETIIECGGTITHHHSVGRDHRPGYDRERPPLFAEALRAVKQTLDPDGMLNPGVLV
jgi:alkyldihydroxyacetonephosphate synthase